MPRHRALDHAAGDEVVEEERLDLGGELVGFRSLVVEAVGIACHERFHGRASGRP